MFKTVADLLMGRLIEWDSIRMVENAIREVV